MKTLNSTAPFGEIYSPPEAEVIETRVESGFATTGPDDFTFGSI